MKKLLLFIAFWGVVGAAFAQRDSTRAPYKRFPTVPAFRLLLADSTTILTKDDLKKNKALLIIVFSPECEHCQHETEELLKYKEQLKDVQIVMATTYPIFEMKSFYEKYQLATMDNVIMGQDYKYILPSFFDMSNFPFIALYNKKKELITTFDGAVGMPKIVEAFSK